MIGKPFPPRSFHIVFNLSCQFVHWPTECCLCVNCASYTTKLSTVHFFARQFYWNFANGTAPQQYKQTVNTDCVLVYFEYSHLSCWGSRWIYNRDHEKSRLTEKHLLRATSVSWLLIYSNLKRREWLHVRWRKDAFLLTNGHWGI